VELVLLCCDDCDGCELGWLGVLAVLDAVDGALLDGDCDGILDGELGVGIEVGDDDDDEEDDEDDCDCWVGGCCVGGGCCCVVSQATNAPVSTTRDNARSGMALHALSKLVLDLISVVGCVLNIVDAPSVDWRRHLYIAAPYWF